MARTLREGQAVWSLTLCRLHFSLATTATLQLLLSLRMDPKGEGWEKALFLVHQLDGLLVFTLVVFHWLWLARGDDGGIVRLFCWLTAAGRRAILDDLRALLRRRLPRGGPRMGLPAAVEGIGLSLVTLQGSTGFLFFTAASLEGTLPEPLQPLVQFHKLCGELLWIFLAGHGGMALLHAVSGDPVLRAISPFRR